MIAPWVTPPNYLEAMRAGAGLGLAAAAQDISGEESADRLRLAYSQMAQQERQQQRQLEAAREYRAAQQLLRQGQMDALARYRQQMEADRTQRANLAERQFQAMDLYRQQQASALEAQRQQQHQDAAARLAETQLWHDVMAGQRGTPKEEFVKTDTGQNAVVVRDAQGNPIGIRPLPTEKTPEEIAAEKAAQLEANKPSWLSRLFTKPTMPIVTPPGFGGATPSAEPATPAPTPRQGVRVLSITRRPDAASAPAAKPPITVNDIAPVPQDPVAVEQQRRVQLAQAVNLANEREKKQLEDARKRNEDVSGIVSEIFRRVMGERGTYDMLLDRPPER